VTGMQFGPLEILINCDKPGCTAEQQVTGDELPTGWHRVIRTNSPAQTFCPQHSKPNAAEVTVLEDPPWLPTGTTLYHIGNVSVQVRGELFRLGGAEESPWQRIEKIPRLIVVLGAAYDGQKP